MKLSQELSKRDTGRTLYFLDEPTTGLHFPDVLDLPVVFPGYLLLSGLVLPDCQPNSYYPFFLIETISRLNKYLKVLDAQGK